MKCPLENCGKTFRQTDVLTNSVYDSIHGRHIGNNWLTKINCPHCHGGFVVKLNITMEAFGYGDKDKNQKRRTSDKIKQVS